ncbi:hypothetical protein ACOSP7_003589 [Xanthoceras sorbifolium]
MADLRHSYPKPPQFPPNLTREPLHSPVELKGGGGPNPDKRARKATHFLCKFLFFALFLVAIPLFPSQAPGFISQSVLTKFWELVHLLFIGVAVSYGIFCRRNVDVDIESYTTNDYDSESYVSRVFRVSSIFEDGFDNSSGYGETNVYQTLYSENYKGSFVMSEQKKMGSFNSEFGLEYSCGYGENNVSQAWNSQYFQGESVAVVAQPDCSLNPYGESGSMMGHTSLNLPVRSLRSGDGDQDGPEISDGSESSSPSKDSSNSPSYVGIDDNEFGDLGPTNLENRFAETDSLSPIPWRSRSGRMEFGANVDATAASRSHFRPLSVDETQFESLKSKSLWSTESFSSQASSMSDSPNGDSPSSHVVSSEFENLRMEELGKGKSFCRSYPPDSVPENNKTSLNAFHIRQYSSQGSLFEKNSRKSFEDDSRDTSKDKREDPLSSDVGKSASPKFERNARNPVKASLRDTSKSKREAPLSDTSKDKREDPLSSDVGKSASPKFERNPRNLVKASLRDTSKSKREAPLSSDVGRTVSSKFDGNPGNVVKSSSRGRSVRTIRSRRFTAEAMKNEERGGNHFSNKLDQKASDEVEVEEAMYNRKHEMRNGGSNYISSTVAQKQDLDSNFPVDMPQETFSDLHKRKNRESSENLVTESREEPAKEAAETENLQVISSNEETLTDSASDAGSNPNEVDKKAGEFIAKFREQIRLQKMASIDRSRGRNYLR